MNALLVPLDGSTLAEQSLPYVRILAPLLHAKVSLLRVVTDAPDDDLLAESLGAVYEMHDPLAIPRERQQHTQEILRQNAERYLEAHAEQLRAAGLDVTVEIQCGPAAEVIVEAAQGQHVTMIVIATHGYGGLKRWALGSVADKVIHAASAPVLVVRTATPARAPTLRRIMVPLDGSALARQALPLAIRLAKSAHAELLLIQAITTTLEAHPGFATRGRPIPQLAEMIDALRDQATSELDTQADALRARDIVVKSAIVDGHAAEVLVDEAEWRKADLIVMATHGYSGLKRWALGSVADKVLHATTTPLLLVRAQTQS
ncbi:MAG TPA: universal stress protein [Roseiflexaceae bacterium]|nr:universal stress protein [Roseiflexaceae bacterium]